MHPDVRRCLFVEDETLNRRDLGHSGTPMPTRRASCQDTFIRRCNFIEILYKLAAAFRDLACTSERGPCQRSGHRNQTEQAPRR